MEKESWDLSAVAGLVYNKFVRVRVPTDMDRDHYKLLVVFDHGPHPIFTIMFDADVTDSEVVRQSGLQAFLDRFKFVIQWNSHEAPEKFPDWCRICRSGEDPLHRHNARGLLLRSKDNGCNSVPRKVIDAVLAQVTPFMERYLAEFRKNYSAPIMPLNKYIKHDAAMDIAVEKMMDEGPIVKFCVFTKIVRVPMGGDKYLYCKFLAVFADYSKPPVNIETMILKPKDDVGPSLTIQNVIEQDKVIIQWNTHETPLKFPDWCHICRSGEDPLHRHNERGLFLRLGENGLTAVPTEIFDYFLNLFQAYTEQQFTNSMVANVTKVFGKAWPQNHFY